MKKKSKILILSIVCLSCILACSSEDGDGKKLSGSDEMKDINLSDELMTPGNDVSLPSTGAGSKSVNGTVVDSDGDGSGDGIDLSGEGTSDIIYGILSSPKTSLKKNQAEAFYLEGGDTTYYFVPDADRVAISTTVYDDSAGVRLVVATDQSLEGLDTSGNGGADDTALNAVVLDDIVLGGSCTYTLSTEGSLNDQYCFSFDDGNMAEALADICVGANYVFNEGQACNLDGAIPGICEYTIFNIIEVIFQFGSTYDLGSSPSNCEAKENGIWIP